MPEYIYVLGRDGSPLYRQGYGKSTYRPGLPEDKGKPAPRSGCLVYWTSGIGKSSRKAARLPSPPDPPVPKTGSEFDRCTGGTDLQTGWENGCQEPEETDRTEDRFPGRMVRKASKSFREEGSQTKEKPANGGKSVSPVQRSGPSDARCCFPVPGSPVRHAWTALQRGLPAGCRYGK